MFLRLLSILLILSNLSAREYGWPIKASKSLSATFCEYRQGHLHAGVDIKTWGETEVPCLAISDGYIQKVIVGYNGYGRGLFFQTDQGHIAVYGHLERFNPAIEKLIREKQRELNRYRVSIRFSPDDFPLKRGKRLGYSGTSGTEHPHLHFEIRDTLGTVFNPQAFYPGIKDTRPPIIDEILLLPASQTSRINQSRHGLIVDPDKWDEIIFIQGPLRVAVNAHDRADGTYNKYSLYEAGLYYNDSLAYAQRFDELPLDLSDHVERVYPGMRGRRGWRFMSLYEDPHGPRMPFISGDLNGEMVIKGLVALEVRLADIKGNQKTADILVREQPASSWELLSEADHYVIIRHYEPQGYQRYQFYTGDNTYIPISQTLHTLSTTEWYLPLINSQKGVRALAGLTGEIKWLIPPLDQPSQRFQISWSAIDNQYFFQIRSEQVYIYPIQFSLVSPSTELNGELIQTNDFQAESSLIPLQMRAEADTLHLVFPDKSKITVPLEPLKRLEADASCVLNHTETGFSLHAENPGSSPLYVHCDTIRGNFSDQDIPGLKLQIIGEKDSFSGTMTYIGTPVDSVMGIYKQHKKNQWRLLEKADSTGVIQYDLNGEGEFFLLRDTDAPHVRSKNGTAHFKRGKRLVFAINENTGILAYPQKGFVGLLDGQQFFPDYNPLRKELSFHVPNNAKRGQHQFEVSLRDQAGNTTKFNYQFSVTQ